MKNFIPLRLLCLFALFANAGCNMLGPVGAVLGQAAPNMVGPQYKGLAGQRVAVMVWADPGIRADWPYLPLDIASGLQDKLKTIQKDAAPTELAKATFPVRVESVARYQEDHPEMENAPITETAAKFDVDRLIYIEVTEFATRSDASLDLYRGTITGTVQVIEIKDHQAKAAFTEPDVKASYPKDSPKEGMPEGSDEKIYHGTLNKFTTALTNRFYTHEEEPDSVGPDTSDSK